MTAPKFLLTWYGITDLKAALGLEQSNGPVLEALLQGGYSCAVILAYEKTDNNEVCGQNLKKVCMSVHNQEKINNSEIESIANYSETNNFYKKWLERNLQEKNCNTNIELIPVKLENLNDSRNIYNNIFSLLKKFEKKPSIEVSLFLSPGTPVMAFCSAFAALHFPNMKIKLLSSAKTGCKPEEIALPEETRKWITDDRFYTVFHLVDEQLVPLLQGILQFPSKKHVFVSRPQYAEKIKKVIPHVEKNNSLYEELILPSNNPAEITQILVDRIQRIPKSKKIAFNLTCGDKILFAGSLEASRKTKSRAFYFDIDTKNVIDLISLKQFPKKCINNIDTFLSLIPEDFYLVTENDKNESQLGIDETEISILSKEMWENFLRKGKICIKIEGKDYDIEGFITQDFSNQNMIIQIVCNDKIFTLKNINAAKKYLHGGWFEYFIFDILKPYQEKGYIKDLKKNIFINMKNLPEKKFAELDIIFTDGYLLYFIECKTFTLETDFVAKIAHLARLLGGKGSRAILISPQMILYDVKEYAKKLGVKLISGQSIPELLADYLKEQGILQ